MLLEHKYGENIHILNSPFISHILTTFSSDAVQQPQLTAQLKTIYEHMMSVVLSQELATKTAQTQTRMAALHPDSPLSSVVFDSSQKVVSVDIARAGMIPSQLCYEILNLTLPPKNVRQDHIWAARKTNELNQVIGTEFDGSKIGGPVDDAVVFLPDPMGATGGTLKNIIQYYEENVEGTAKSYVGLHLIVTPEFLKTIKDIPKLKIYTCRVDRGLSPKNLLNTIPGTHWDEERGINENGYIVPGAGGVGELLNNAYV